MNETIVVDMDGCICENTKPYKKAKPIRENIEKINSLSVNNKIIIFTSRYKQDRPMTIEWLKNNGVIYDRLVTGKIKYDIIIDDKAINIEDV